MEVALQWIGWKGDFFISGAKLELLYNHLYRHSNRAAHCGCYLPLLEQVCCNKHKVSFSDMRRYADFRATYQGRLASFNTCALFTSQSREAWVLRE